ncbi:dihydrodipicolinate synthase family protein [Streptomyces sp. NRRL F-5126]|uniref:dihydrodipicolinate synthase family protein n=1 Tax=Streptomyces sp. NRRL F-5126 TaxID=1463857 RepID=UPI0004CA4A6A|nr:dihydrodipicolinate synthase family protein [Streptomyces sp. NRRL F-5126]
MTQLAFPHGIHVPLITPFTADGSIAENALEALAHTVLDEGANGIVALGTTAEAAMLDKEEKTVVVGICARVCRERGAPLTIGLGGSDTRATARALKELGKMWPETTAALVPVPAFSRPGAAGVVAHFAHLAEHSPIPLIVYHVPYRTAQPLDAATLRAVGEHPNVRGIKLATGRVDQETVDLLGDLPPDLAVLAGDDVLLAPLLALGAAGGVLASAHLATARFTELVTAWHNGDHKRARELGPALARLSAATLRDPNPAVIKGVLQAQGRIPTPDVRLPLLKARRASVGEALEEMGVILP